MTFRLSIESKPDGKLKVDIEKDGVTYTFEGDSDKMKADYKPKDDFDDNAVVELYDRFCVKYGKISIVPKTEKAK